jgi:hypothetical protein
MVSANSLISNFNKTKFIQFSTKLKLGTSICIDYEHNHIENSQSTSFWGIILDRTLTWHPHIDKICAKLQSACYILRTLKPVLSVNNLKMIYFSYIHSIITYGIILGGNSAGSDKVFKLQKRAVRIITNSHSSISCHNLFKELNILHIQSQYILSLAVYVAKNIDDFTTNSVNHSINTRHISKTFQKFAKKIPFTMFILYCGITP